MRKAVGWLLRKMGEEMTGAITIILMLTIAITLLACRICFSLMGIEQILERIDLVTKEIYAITQNTWFESVVKKSKGERDDE